MERLVAASARRPRRTLGAIGLVTGVLALGLGGLRFRTGILDWLPRSDPHVRAFARVLGRLDGITNEELLWLELDPEKAARAGVHAIWEEEAVRAQQELIEYVRARVPRIRHAFGIPYWFALLHRIQKGGGSEAQRLPEHSFEFELYWRVLSTVAHQFVEAEISSDGRGTFVGLVLEGNPLGRLARDLGRAVGDAVESYKRDPGRRYDLFRDDLIHPVGLASGTATIDRTLRGDVLRILPLAVAFLVAALLIAFRRPFVAGAGIAMVLLGVAWTYGLMGHLGVPLNIVNVALVPLVFGCGVDYAIHLLNEYAHLRARGVPRDEVLVAAARTSGIGILLTTATTVAGLLAIALSDAPGMIQLGLFAACGMVVLAFLALTFLPAVLSLRRERPTAPPFREGRLIGAAMESLGRRRGLAVAVFLGVTAAFVLFHGRPVYLMDVIEGNYRPGEPVARVVARMRAEAGGAFPEFVIIEGDLADPSAVAAVEELERGLARALGPPGRVASASYADVLGAHEILAEGLGGAIPAFIRAGGDLARGLPQGREGISSVVEAMAGDEGWRPLSSLFLDPSARIGLILLLPGKGWEGYEGAARLWGLLDKGVREAAGAARDMDLRFSFLGYRTMAYLFVRQSLHWLRVLFVVSLAAVLLLVAMLLRDRRALVACGSLMLATGIWWLGLLHLRGIYVSVFLLFPLVFIVCIGSDYGLHLCWRLSRGEPPARVYRTTGKAILFSALTDGGVFALFSTMRLVSASQVMESVALAVAAVFAATVILVPAVFGARASR